MICLLLTAALGLPLQDDVVTLQHATKLETTLGPDDPVLDGVGPSKTFRYELAGDDSVIFLWATSDEMDLVLRADFGLLEPKPRGAAALFAPKKKPKTGIEDDDSGGGTTPFLRLDRKGGGTLTITVAAKGTATTEWPFTIHCFEAQETEATRSAATVAFEAVKQSRRLRSEDDYAASRRVLAEALPVLVAAPGAERSDQVSRVIWEIAAGAYYANDLRLAKSAWESVDDFRRVALPKLHRDRHFVRVNLNMAAGMLGDVASARAGWEELLAIARSHLPDDHPEVLMLRNNLAITLNALGDVDGALAIEKEVFEIRSRSLPDDHPDLQISRVNLSNRLKSRGDYIGARALLEKAIPVLTRTSSADDLSLQKARLNLATTIYALGDTLGARALLEGVLEVYDRILPDDHPDLQLVRGNLANTLIKLGNSSGARVLQEKVLEVYRETEPEDDLTLQLLKVNLASTLIDLGELSEAQELIESTLRVYARLGLEKHQECLYAKAQLAWAYSARGELEIARTLYEELLDTYVQMLPADDRELQGLRLRLADLLVELGEVASSRDLARDVAQATIEKARSLASPDTVAETSRPLLSGTLSIALGRKQDSRAPDLDRLAFSMCEALRGASLQADRLGRLLNQDAAAVQLKLEIAATARRVAEKRRETARSGGETNLLVDLLQERSRLERDLLDRLREQGVDQWLPTLDVDSIRGQLGPDQAAVAFWRYRKWQWGQSPTRLPSVPSYVAWVIRPEEPLRRIELGPAEVIETAIQSWRSALKTSSRDASAPSSQMADRLGRTLTRLLIDPARDAIGDAKQLLVAPSHQLYLVPFDALPDGDGVLGDRHRVSYRHALSELTIQVPTPVNENRLLVVGGLDFDSGASQVEESLTATPRSLGASAIALRGAEAGSTFSRFPALNGSEEEALTVASYFSRVFQEQRTRAPEILTGQQGTRESFEALAPSCRYLHIATHGWFALESAADSTDDRVIDRATGRRATSLTDQVTGLAPSLLCGLAFAGANQQADSYGRVRGLVTAEEIGAMDLSGVSLCVLSACETTLGLEQEGRGLASLQSALHAAGVRTAITSLWKVPDEATRELMTEFYRRLWVLEEPKAQALWNAKQKIRTQLDDEGKPVYSIRDWAGWVLSGDPE